MAFLVHATDDGEYADAKTLRDFLWSYKSESGLTWDQLASRLLERSEKFARLYKDREKSDAIDLLSRKLSDYKTTENSELSTSFCDALLEYFLIFGQSEYPHLVRIEKFRLLLERFSQAKQPFRLNEALHANADDQDKLLREFRTTFLFVTRSDNRGLKLSYLRIIDGSIEQHSLPRFDLWRRNHDGRYSRYRGFAMLAGSNVYLTGTGNDECKIWSAIFKPIGRDNDLHGHKLALENGYARCERCYCINLSKMRAVGPQRIRLIQDAESLASVVPEFSKTRLRMLNDFLFDASSQSENASQASTQLR